MPVPDGPHTTRFSWRSIHSRVAQRSLGRSAGSTEIVSSQVSNVLPVGNPAALRRVTTDDRLPASEFLGEQGPHGFGGFPALRLRGGEHVGGVSGACAAAAGERSRSTTSSIGVVGRRRSSLRSRSHARVRSLHRVGFGGAADAHRPGGRRGSLRGRPRRNARNVAAWPSAQSTRSMPCRRAESTARPIFTLTAAVPARRLRSSHSPCALTQPEELGLGLVGGLRLTGQSARAGRGG